jgi:hypothetical protein
MIKFTAVRGGAGARRGWRDQAARDENYQIFPFFQSLMSITNKASVAPAVQIKDPMMRIKVKVSPNISQKWQNIRIVFQEQGFLS